MNELLWKSIIIIGSMLIALAGSLGIVKWKHDNAVEQLAEQFVESETGWKVDLTPDDEALAELALRHPAIDMVQTSQDA